MLILKYSIQHIQVLLNVHKIIQITFDGTKTGNSVHVKWLDFRVMFSSHDICRNHKKKVCVYANHTKKCWENFLFVERNCAKKWSEKSMVNCIKRIIRWSHQTVEVTKDWRPKKHVSSIHDLLKISKLLNLRNSATV